MRIQRQHDDAPRALVIQLLQRVRNRRFAVGHAEYGVHRPGEALLELVLQRPRDVLGDTQQRRAVLGPYLRIRLGRALRPERQDETVENHQPDRPRNLDDALIGEELPQVAAHRAGRRVVRRSEVDDEHAE